MGGDPTSALAIAQLASSLIGANKARGSQGSHVASGVDPLGVAPRTGPIFPSFGKAESGGSTGSISAGNLNGNINPANSYALEQLINQLVLAKMSGGGTLPFGISGGNAQQLNPMQMLAGAGGSGNYGSISSLQG